MSTKRYQKLTQESFLNSAEEIHGTKYDYSHVIVKNYGTKTKIKIICEVHGPFYQLIGNHIGLKHGCPRCAGNVKLTRELFIEKSITTHGDKYDYSKVSYVNSGISVSIICKTHGPFNQRPLNHIRGSGCIKCGDERRSLAYSSNTQEFIKKDKLIHGDLDGYDRLNYVNNRVKVEIFCKKCKEYYWQNPANRINPILKARCRRCRPEKMSKMFRDSTEDFIKKAIGIHGSTYQYDKVEYKNNHTKILITCPKHGKFQQVPSSHLCGVGCPICKTSRGEVAVRVYLENRSIEFISQKTFDGCRYKRPLKFDFYLPEYNMAIEYDGEQHFRPVEVFGGQSEFEFNQLKDKIKNEFCRTSGIPLLRVKYDDDVDELLSFSISEVNKLL
jgi:hypothetical protein